MLKKEEPLLRTKDVNESCNFQNKDSITGRYSCLEGYNIEKRVFTALPKLKLGKENKNPAKLFELTHIPTTTRAIHTANKESLLMHERVPFNPIKAQLYKGVYKEQQVANLKKKSKRCPIEFLPLNKKRAPWYELREVTMRSQYYRHNYVENVKKKGLFADQSTVNIGLLMKSIQDRSVKRKESEIKEYNKLLSMSATISRSTSVRDTYY